MYSAPAPDEVSGRSIDFRNLVEMTRRENDPAIRIQLNRIRMFEVDQWCCKVDSLRVENVKMIQPSPIEDDVLFCIDFLNVIFDHKRIRIAVREELTHVY